MFGRKKHHAGEVISHLNKEEEDKKAVDALIQKKEELYDVYTNKCNDLRNEYNSRAKELEDLKEDKEFSVMVCPETLKYVVCDTEIPYPDYIFAFDQRYKTIMKYLSHEEQIDRIEQMIGYCDAFDFSPVISTIYETFWNRDEAIAHIKIVQDNLRNLGGQWHGND